MRSIIIYISSKVMYALSQKPNCINCIGLNPPRGLNQVGVRIKGRLLLVEIHKEIRQIHSNTSEGAAELGGGQTERNWKGSRIAVESTRPPFCTTVCWIGTTDDCVCFHVFIGYPPNSRILVG